MPSESMTAGRPVTADTSMSFGAILLAAGLLPADSYGRLHRQYHDHSPKTTSMLLLRNIADDRIFPIGRFRRPVVGSLMALSKDRWLMGLFAEDFKCDYLANMLRAELGVDLQIIVEYKNRCEKIPSIWDALTIPASDL